MRYGYILLGANVSQERKLRMRGQRILLVLGAIWLVVFILLAALTPARYVEVAQTAPGVTHVVSVGEINGGPVGALLASALRALFITGFIGVAIVILGSIVMGIRPFLTRIGALKPEERDE